MKNLSKLQKTVICIFISLIVLFPVCFSQAKLKPTFPVKKEIAGAKKQCSAITQKGTQCKRKSNVTSIYCTQHYNISLKYKQ